PGKVLLNYLVDSATWKPQYKFRAAKDKDPVQVEYLAAVLQQTGEEWGNVDVTLSTAQPLLNAAPPELKGLEVAAVPKLPHQPAPGQVAIFGGRPVMALSQDAQGKRVQAQQEIYSKKEATANTLINEAAALEQTRDLLACREDEIRRARRGAPSGEGP